MNRKKGPVQKNLALKPASVVSPVKPVLAPQAVPQRHVSESDSESESSSGSSDSDSESESEEPKTSLSTPQLPERSAPLTETVPQTFDALAWSNIGSEVNVAEGNNDGLWSSFRTKEQEQKESEMERKQMEARVLADHARQVDELRKKAEEARAKQEEQNLRSLREREQEIERREQEREKEREAAKEARQNAKRVDLGGHSFYDLMDSLG